MVKFHKLCLKKKKFDGFYSYSAQTHMRSEKRQVKRQTENRCFKGRVPSMYGEECCSQNDHVLQVFLPVVHTLPGYCCKTIWASLLGISSKYPHVVLRKQVFQPWH